MNRLLKYFLDKEDDSSLLAYLDDRSGIEEHSKEKYRLKYDYAFFVNTLSRIGARYRQVCEELYDTPGADPLYCLTSFIRILLKHISYSSTANFVYRLRPSNDEICAGNIPMNYPDGSGNLIELPGKVDIIDLNETNLVDCIFDSKKWKYHLYRKTDLDPALMKGEGLPLYYPALDIVFAGSGCRHRTAEAYMNRRKAMAKVIRYDDTILLRTVTTDGKNWNSVSDGTIISPVFDSRYSLVYILRQMEMGIIDPATVWNIRR